MLLFASWLHVSSRPGVVSSPFTQVWWEQPQGGHWALCWAIMVHHYAGSSCLKSSMHHRQICHICFSSLSLTVSCFIFLAHLQLYIWSNNASLHCHALQHAWSGCQETVWHFQDNTPTPRIYRITHNRGGRAFFVFVCLFYGWCLVAW